MTLLLCSNLGYDPNDKSVRPFTVHQFTALEQRFREHLLPIGDILTKGIAHISEQLSLTKEEIARINTLMLRADKISAEINRLAESRIYIATRRSEQYPKRLLKTMGKSAPVLLYYCGNIDNVNSSTVAVIGSRTATEQENAFARRHVKMSVQNGATLISGGAKGIDTVAKETALKSGGRAVTFVSDSMTKYSKANAEYILYDKMLVLSAVHPEMTFRGYNALERNRYIYASSDYAVVVSSGDEKGGSYQGAATCLKQNLTQLYVKDDGYAPPGNKKLIALGGLPMGENHERLDETR